MRTAWLIAPGPLGQRTGGYIYDARIAAGLRTLGWDVHARALSGEAPMPDLLAACLARIEDGGLTMIDGLCLAGAADILAAERDRLHLVGLMHHPAALETGIVPEAARRLLAAETAALSHLARIVVTSPHTARILQRDLAVAARQIAVVEPGTDPARLAAGSADGGCRLLAVGAAVPRKGYEILLPAVAALSALNWELSVIGALDRDADYSARVREIATQCGIADRVEWVGEREAPELAAAYDRADLFVSASWYEGYGMAVAEAVARGLPVVSTAAGAVAETLPDGAGLLVPPGDVDALADALRRLLTDSGLRARLAAGARAARSRLPTWDQQARRFADVLEAVGR